MTDKKMILILFNIFFIFCNCQKSENPINICKDCGSFDLSKVKFTENIADLTSKAEVSKSTLTLNGSSSQSNDKLYENNSGHPVKYSFLNGRNLTLGKDPFNYNNQFNFNQLTILSDSSKKILALSASVFYSGNSADITKFVDFLKKEHKTVQVITGKMYGDLTVYQWFLKDRIIQLVKDNKEGTEEQTLNGKTVTVKSTYLKINIYGHFFIENPVKNVVENDSDFVLFDQRHFIKD